MGWERARLAVRSWGLAAAIVLVVGACPGCTLVLTAAGALASVGVVEYAKGEIRYTEEVSFYRAYVATLGALEALAFPITDEWVEGDHAHFVAREVDDTAVKITLEQTTPKLTQIRIRVGHFGDESLSRRIVEEIRTRF